MLDRLISKGPWPKTGLGAFHYTAQNTGPGAVSTIMRENGWSKHPNVLQLPHDMTEVIALDNFGDLDLTTAQIKEKYPWAIGIHRPESSWIPAKEILVGLAKTYSFVNDWSDYFIIGLLFIAIACLIIIIVLGAMYYQHVRPENCPKPSDENKM